MNTGVSISASYLIEIAKTSLRNRPFVVLTGAGVSTNSGLPDYRGQGKLRRESPNLDRFLGDSAVRASYWRHTLAGWATLAAAQPTSAHFWLARLESAGICAGVITQNVDGLHSAAGSKKVVELHGNERYVVCVECGNRLTKSEFLTLCQGVGGDVPTWNQEATTVPNCHCGGLYRPSVTFFGESVDQVTFAHALKQLQDAAAMLILGTSLQVNSGFQLLQAALDKKLMTVLVNAGPSRGEGLVDVFIRADTDQAMDLMFTDTVTETEPESE